jgi:hypothetical protein
LIRFIEKYLLCQKCEYPETTLYVSKQKKLMSKCRACGNLNQLDDTHRAGTHLMKNVPTNMDEIDGKKTGDVKDPQLTEGGGGAGAAEEKKEKKVKKSKKKDGAAEEGGDGATAAET